MSTEEHFESLDSDSPNTTPRGERKVFQGRSPGLVSRPSPFYLNMKKEYAQIPTGPNTGRSIVSNQHDISEAKRLYERSSTVERGREGFEFGPDTEQWTATHRYRGEDGEEEKDNFTFQDQDHDDEDIAKKEVVLEIKEKKGGKDTKKRGKKKSEKEKGASEADKPVGQEQKADESKKKKKKNADGGKMPVKKNSEDLGQAGNAEASVERDEKAEVKKKSGKKGRTNKTKTTNSSNSSIEQEKKNDGDLSAGFKKKPKEMNLRQLMASKNRSNLSISDHHEMTNDPRFLITDSLSCVSSPQSLLALTKGESCPSPSGPQPLKAKTKKKEKVSKKDRKKKYELEPKDGEKPVKQKVKKQHAKGHHHHHHMDEPKRILLTDGLNLVKLMTARTNCKKTKGLIILYTFTVLWSIVLNGLEFNFFTETRCKTYTENGSAYLSFILTICLKLLSVSLFNLELTFKQPYKPSIGLLYSFAIQCFCPLLQLPQNVYDFSSCKEVNHVIRLRDSWRFLQAVIGTMLGIVAYIVIKQRIEAEVLKSRIGRLLNRIVKGVVILAGLAWNVVLFVVFCAQNNIFLPSLFFDFYLYIGLAFGVVVFNWKKRKLGVDGLKAALIKDEKKLNEPLTQSQPVQIKEMVKIEVQP